MTCSFRSFISGWFLAKFIFVQIFLYSCSLLWIRDLCFASVLCTYAMHRYIILYLYLLYSLQFTQYLHTQPFFLRNKQLKWNPFCLCAPQRPTFNFFVLLLLSLVDTFNLSSNNNNSTSTSSMYLSIQILTVLEMLSATHTWIWAATSYTRFFFFTFFFFSVFVFFLVLESNLKICTTKNKVVSCLDDGISFIRNSCGHLAFTTTTTTVTTKKPRFSLSTQFVWTEINVTYVF